MNLKNTYRICNRCIMDTSDPHIVFDGEGNCNHCTLALRSIQRAKSKLNNNNTLLNDKIQKIKSSSGNEKYDCVIGVSGGVDSTYLAYLVKKEYGLNPLAVHLDNGWNSKLAVRNIKNCLSKLDIDLHTHVIDWNEFRKMQLAYLYASVIDIEVLTDHAIAALLYKTADDYNIGYVLTGMNPLTESILPKSWAFNKNDLINLKDILDKKGPVKIQTFPTLSRREMKKINKKVEKFAPYEYIDFDLVAARQIIEEELRWKPYEVKHGESVWTRFYQGYILPQKFNVDKRRGHMSNQICLGVISREEALSQIAEPPYTEEDLASDYEFVLKKLGLTKTEFESIMSLPVKSHFDYKVSVKSVILKKIMVPGNPIYTIYKRLVASHSYGNDL